MSGRPHYYRGRRLADYPGLLAYAPLLPLYPLHLAPLTTNIIFSGLLWLGLQHFAGLVILVMCSPLLMAYLELIIERSSHGEADPPALAGEQAYFTNPATARFLLWPLLVLSLWLRLRLDEPELAGAVVWLGWFVFPAYLLLGTHFGVISALNPLRQLQVIVLTGWLYLAACALLAGSGLLLLIFAQHLALYPLLFLTLYLLLMTAHLLGCAAYWRAERLGLEAREATSHAQEEREAAQDAWRDKVLDDIHTAWRDNDLPAQVAALEQRNRAVTEPLAFAEQLFSRLHEVGHKKVLLLQGARLLQVLIEQGGMRRALEVYRQCLDHSAAFNQYLAAPQLLALARYAVVERADREFDSLSESLLGAHTDAPERIELAVLRASYLMDVRGDDEAAAAVLSQLPEDLGQHPDANKLRALRRILKP